MVIRPLRNWRRASFSLATVIGVLGLLASAQAAVACESTSDVGSLNLVAANEYACSYAGSHNTEYATYVDDSANFLSQLLKAGQVTESDGDWNSPTAWWTDVASEASFGSYGNKPEHSQSWTLTPALYHYLLESGLFEALPTDTTLEHTEAGDVIFWDWAPVPGVYDDVGMIMSGSGSEPAHEMFASHIPGMSGLESMTNLLEDKIGPFLHGINGECPESDPGEGSHGHCWSWHILRPVAGSYVCRAAPESDSTSVTPPEPSEAVEGSPTVLCPEGKVVVTTGAPGAPTESGTVTETLNECRTVPYSGTSDYYCHAGFRFKVSELEEELGSSYKTFWGTSAAMAQPEPALGPEGKHSLAEEDVGDAEHDYVELGWTVAPGQFEGSTTPHLFASSWRAGHFQGYENTNPAFVSASDTSYAAGLPVLVTPTPQEYSILHNQSLHRWELFYEGSLIGWFKDSDWNGKFRPTYTEWFGEVDTGSTTVPTYTEMGNGQHGSTGGSACSHAALIDNIYVSIETYSDTLYLPESIGGNLEDDTLYTAHRAGSRGFRYGGRKACE